MSVFKANGIVLMTKKNTHGDVFHDIFFYEFGILSVAKSTKKKEKPLDMGDILGCELRTSSSGLMPQVSNFRKKFSFHSGDSYVHMENFMKICAYIMREIPKKYPHHVIWKILQEIIETQEKMSTKNYTLSILKINAVLGKLPNEHEDSTTQKILRFIHASGKVSELYRLTGIPEKNIKDLQCFID